MSTSPVPIDIQKYLNADLFDELGMTFLTAEERARFLEEMGSIVQQRVTLRLWDELSEEQHTEMDAITEKEEEQAPQALVEFLAHALPNYEELILEEIAAYKKELMERFSAMQPN